MKFQRICDQLCPADHEAAELYAGLQDGDVVEVQLVVSRRRTMSQNNALHQFLTDLASTLNEAGLDMRTVIKQDVDIPWTKDSAKQYLWRPIQKALTGKESTAEAKTPDYNEVYQTLCRYLGDRLGVQAPQWPSVR